MNKAFKIIWSEARNAYIVVSELAKKHCRASKTISAAVMVSVLAGTMAAAPAWAKITETSKKYTVATGNVITTKDDHDNPSGPVTTSRADMAIGTGSIAKGGNSTAIGNDSSVDGDFSIAIGNNSKVIKGSSSVAVGNSSKAEGSSTTAIGAQAIAKNGGTAIGQSSKANALDSVAVGIGSTVDNGGGVAIGRAAANTTDPNHQNGSASGVAIGEFSKAYGQSIAIGSNSNALGSYSIALGEGSNVYAGSKFSSIFGHESTIAENSSYSFVSGSNSTIGENSGYSTLIGSYANIYSGSQNSILLGSIGTIGNNANGSIAIGNETEVQDGAQYSTVIGYGSKATNKIWNGTALGRKSVVSVTNGVALGSYSVANTGAGIAGYDILTGEDSTDKSPTWKASYAAVSVGGKGKTRQITNVAAGTNDTDAVNVAQLKRAIVKFEAGNGIVIEAVKGDAGTTYKISTNITGADTKTDITTVKPGDGGVAGANTGTAVSVPNQPATDKNISTGAPVVIETVTKPTNFAADEGDKLEISPSETLGIKGDSNITTITTKTDAAGKNIQVTLKKDLKVDSVTANKFVAGDTTITNNGLEIKNGPSVTNNGINASDKKVTNVADGEISATSKDAVNGSQLYATNQEVINNANNINKLGSRVNKVGAGAAALAALHPMDFDPDDKLTFSAGYGNYAGQNAAAIGAYYRPDEKVMFSVGGTVGNGENMVNAGVSFALDRTNHVSNSRTAMAREILDLRAEVNELKAMVAKGALGSIEEDKMKIFPDIAENHWAYEYIGKMAAAGIVEGYPDGNFNGDRMMTRYEFAAMLYRAMQKGAQLDSKIVNEFAPEMGRIRVDRISGEDGERNKIERVRVNATKGERDHYGNKLAK